MKLESATKELTKHSAARMKPTLNNTATYSTLRCVYNRENQDISEVAAQVHSAFQPNFQLKQSQGWQFSESQLQHLDNIKLKYARMAAQLVASTALFTVHQATQALAHLIYSEVEALLLPALSGQQDSKALDSTTFLDSCSQSYEPNNGSHERSGEFTDGHRCAINKLSTIKRLSSPDLRNDSHHSHFISSFPIRKEETIDNCNIDIVEFTLGEINTQKSLQDSVDTRERLHRGKDEPKYNQVSKADKMLMDGQSYEYVIPEITYTSPICFNKRSIAKGKSIKNKVMGCP